MAVVQQIKSYQSVEERRAWVREPVDQPAMVLTASGRQIEARISDFCPGGMYIRPRRTNDAPDVASLEHDEPLKIYFKTPHNAQRYHVSAQVARASSVGAGLRFAKPHKPFYRVLHRVAQSQTPQDRVQGVTHFDRRRILRELAQGAETAMTVLMEEFIVTAQIKLMNRCDAEYQDEDQDRLREAMVTMRALERALTTIVPKSVARALRHPDLSGDGSDGASGGDVQLELVDVSHFDHWMNVAELAARGESRYPIELFELRHRIGLVLGQTIDRENNPVSPLNITQTFARALDTLPLSVLSLHALYSAYDLTVVSGLGRLYDQLNQALISAGVAPVVSHGMPNWMPETD